MYKQKEIEKYILNHIDAEDEILKELDREVKAIVTESAEFAQQSPEPDPSELWTDVLVET